MGKKKKRDGAPKVNSPNQFGTIPPQGRPPTAQDIEQRRQVVERLSKAFKALSEPPESILALFERVGLEYELEKVDTDDGQSHSMILIKYDDLLAAEERNQSQGSVISRLYPEEALPNSGKVEREPEEPVTVDPNPVVYQPDPDNYEEYDLGKVQG